MLSNNLEKLNINYYYYRTCKNINYITNKIKKMYISVTKIILKNVPNSVKLIVFQNKEGNNILNKYISQINVKYKLKNSFLFSN